MTIVLSAALRRYVDRQVKNGRYLDASDVVREALRPQFTNLGSISKRWECSKRVLGGTGCL
jgi:hypothetical protein